MNPLFCLFFLCICVSSEVVCVRLNQHSLGPQERLLAFCDRNRDLFIAALSSGIGSQPISTFKLHTHVESFTFNDETDVLVGFADGRLNVWYSPIVAFTEKSLLPSTTASIDASDYGRNAQITSYCGNRISIRKVDGSMLYSSTSPDVPLLYELTRGGRWEESIRLCRYQKNNTLWGAFATMAISKKQLDPAEIALSELNEVAKVSLTPFILLLLCYDELFFLLF
jgi:intraflagellar transport protein 80